MRIRRISLRDFRGVSSAEIGFDTSGVTIVEGPNEIGKTSLADAFDMLLAQKDSSLKRAVKAAKPIGRDVGPFVEAELDLGTYRLVYRKRWLRDKLTELEILEPALEQLTGEDAHNRMSSLLDVETDQALFAALRYQQGSAISQAPIAGAPSLVAALDAAAGGGQHDPAEAGRSDVLLRLVDKERLRYFTPGGKITGDRVEKGEQLKALDDELSALETSIAELDQAAARLSEIEREMVELRGHLPDVEERIAAGSKEVEALEAVEQRAEAARQEFKLAELAFGDAETKQEAREKLIEAAERAAVALQNAVSDLAAEESGLIRAQEHAAEAREAHEAAAGAARAAEDTVKAERDRLEGLELSFRRDELAERRRRFESAEREIGEAERFLAESTIDGPLVAAIDEAAVGAAVADGKAEAGQARLLVEALKPIDLRLDSDSKSLGAGQAAEIAVAAETTAVIDDVARVTVVPPRVGSEVESEAVSAHDRLRVLLEAAGVASAAEAHDRLRERSRREGDRDNARKRRAEALIDLEPAAVVAKLERAEARLAEYERGGGQTAPTPAAFDEARERLCQVEERRNEASEAADGARLKALEVEEVLRVVEDRSIERRTRRDAAEDEAKRAEGEIEAARAETGDGDINDATAAGGKRVAAAQTELEEAEAEGLAGDPESVRATFKNNQELKERLNNDLGDRRVAAAQVGERLRIGGLEGLSSRGDDIRVKVVALEREIAAEDRLATAAKHLYELLIEKREQAQRAYAGPFVEKLNAYARVLFGPSVKVEVDHRDFSIAARSLDGTTVPFDSLSGGAREQLAVLARLACAALVSPGGSEGVPHGVPVVIDDALGYSDPSRLEKLGAAFGVAGRDCQVIVLTCEPGRYRDIGGATVVTFDRLLAASEGPSTPLVN